MRFDHRFVKRTALDFAKSDNAMMWYFVADEIRSALVDQCIMNCVRMAAADEDVSAALNERVSAPFSPDKLLEFRTAVVMALDRGVYSGKTLIRLRFDERPLDERPPEREQEDGSHE